MIDSPLVTKLMFYPRKEELRTNEENGIFGLSFKTSDNTELTGLFFSTKSKDNPTVLFFHGNGEIANDYHNFYDIFTSIDLNFAIIDFRGYGSSGGTSYYSSLLKDPPVIYHQFKNWLANRGYSERIIAMGRSLGGACAVSIGAKNPEGLIGVILESTSSSLVDLTEDTINQSREELPDEMIESMKKWSNDRYITDIDVPVLLIHSSEDRIIPPYHTTKNFKILQKVTDVEKIIIEGANHNNIFSYRREYQNALRNFIQDLRAY